MQHGKSRPRFAGYLRQHQPSPSAMQRLVGIGEDDPGYPYVLRYVFRAYREGRDMSDPDVMASCVDIARRHAERDRLQAVETAKCEQTCWVYYLRVGPYIKIGTAVDLLARMGAYPPDSELLAVEPGYLVKEAERLAEFSEYLSARKEWFSPGPRLMDHITSIRDAELLARLFARRRRAG